MKCPNCIDGQVIEHEVGMSFVDTCRTCWGTAWVQRKPGGCQTLAVFGLLALLAGCVTIEKGAIAVPVSPRTEIDTAGTFAPKTVSVDQPTLNVNAEQDWAPIGNGLEAASGVFSAAWVQGVDILASSVSSAFGQATEKSLQKLTELAEYAVLRADEQAEDSRANLRAELQAMREDVNDQLETLNTNVNEQLTAAREDAKAISSQWVEFAYWALGVLAGVLVFWILFAWRMRG